MVGVDEVVGGEGVRADGRATGVQGFLCEEEEVGKKGRCRGGREEREEEGREVEKEREGKEGKERGEGEVDGEDIKTVCTEYFSDGSYPYT